MVSCPLAECLKILRCMRGTRRLLHAVYPTGYTLPWISVHLLHLFTTIWFICWRNLYLGTVKYILVDLVNWFNLLYEVKWLIRPQIRNNFYYFRSERKYFNSLTSTASVIDLLDEKYGIAFDTPNIGKRYFPSDTSAKNIMLWVYAGNIFMISINCDNIYYMQCINHM